MTSIKRKFICALSCPYCEKVILIHEETETLVKAVPAEKNKKYVAEKEAQTELFNKEEST